MEVTVVINICRDCVHHDYSGVLTPGGTKLMCGHGEAKPGIDISNWKHRLILNESKIPDWCPLKQGSAY